MMLQMWPPIFLQMYVETSQCLLLLGIWTHLFSSGLNGMAWFISCTQMCTLARVAERNLKVVCFLCAQTEAAGLHLTWSWCSSLCYIQLMNFFSAFFFFSFSFLLSFAQEPIRLLSRSHTQNLFLSDLARSQSKSLFRQVGVCSQRCRISSEWLTGHIFSVYGSDCFVFFGLKKIQKIHHTWFWNSHKSSCVLSMLCTNLLISLAICSLLWSISYQEIRTMELCHLCLWCLLFELTDRWLWMQPRLQGILQEHVISISK